MENPEPGESKDLLQVLNELQGQICFVKEMTSSTVRPVDQQGRISRRSRACQLFLPKPFTDANRMKMKSNDVVLRSRTMLDRTWRLRLAHYPGGHGKFAFTSAGWRRFVTDNGVVNGDILIFSLTAISEFLVYMFDSQGLPKSPPMLQLSKRVKVPQRIQGVLESLENKREVIVEEKSPVTRSKTKAQSDDEKADAARYTKAKTMEYSPARTCHFIDFSDEKELLKEADQESPSVMNNTKAEISGGDLKPQLHVQSSASFQKRLLPHLMMRMEIPAAFVRKHGSRIRTVVKLQGPLRGSLVSDVSLCYSTCNGQSRCYFQMKGWRDFVRENMLQEGQSICFTLTADSYFEVKEM